MNTLNSIWKQFISSIFVKPVKQSEIEAVYLSGLLNKYKNGNEVLFKSSSSDIRRNQNNRDEVSFKF